MGHGLIKSFQIIMEPSISLKSFHGFCVMIKVVPMINDFSTNLKVYITVKQEEGHPFMTLLMLYVIISCSFRSVFCTYDNYINIKL